MVKNNSNVSTLLLSRGKVALIDADDYERVSQFKWHAHPASGTGTKWYGRARINNKLVLLHRFILETPANMVTDHCNQNGLDCRRENLRICTRSENACNVSPRRTNRAGYKGVYFYDGKWVAMIRIKGRCVYGGSFNNAEDAAHASDSLAVEHHGDFACLNFPDELPPKIQKRSYKSTLYTYDGKSQILAAWARERQVNVNGLRTRMRRGWDFVRAITTPF